MIQVTEYWNKVIEDCTQPFNTRVLRDVYEVKRQFDINSDLKHLKIRFKGHPRMTIENDRIIEDKGQPQEISAQDRRTGSGRCWNCFLKRNYHG